MAATIADVVYRWKCPVEGCAVNRMFHTIASRDKTNRDSWAGEHKKRYHSDQQVYQSLTCKVTGCKYVALSVSKDLDDLQVRLLEHVQAKHVGRPVHTASPIRQMADKWDGVERRRQPHSTEPEMVTPWVCEREECQRDQIPAWKIWTKNPERRQTLIAEHKAKHHPEPVLPTPLEQHVIAAVGATMAQPWSTEEDRISSELPPRTEALIAVVTDEPSEPQGTTLMGEPTGWSLDKNGREYKDVPIRPDDVSHDYGIHFKRIFRGPGSPPSVVLVRWSVMFSLAVWFPISLAVLGFLIVQVLAQ